MKVALVTPGIYPYVVGGIQQHSFHLARELARLGVEIDLYHTDFSDACEIAGLDGMTEAERSRITSIALPWPITHRLPGHYLRENGRFSRAVLDVMQKRAMVNFVYAQGFLGHGLLHARKQKRLSAPVGINMHGLEMFQPSPTWKAVPVQAMMRGRARASLTGADLVFSFGGKIFDLVTQKIGIPPERVAIIPNGVEPNWVVKQPNRLEPRPLRFVFVGRYERRKAVPEIHQALAQLPNREDWEFSFIGPIPKEKQLRQENVKYFGLVGDRNLMKELLDKSDVLVCPSYSEGMPTVILEAMARGLAILSTDVGAVGSMTCSDNGIVLPEVSVSSIHSGLSRFISMSRDELLAMKHSSHAMTTKFEWPKVAQMTLDAMERSIRHAREY